MLGCRMQSIGFNWFKQLNILPAYLGYSSEKRTLTGGNRDFLYLKNAGFDHSSNNFKAYIIVIILIKVSNLHS